LAWVDLFFELTPATSPHFSPGYAARWWRSRPDKVH